MTPDKAAIGRLGEDEAARVLKRQGYRVIERNYRSSAGEIDIIAMEGDTIVFVEVKTRGGGAFGEGKEGVTLIKQRRIISAAFNYLAMKGVEGAPVRFDVVSINVKDGIFTTEVIRNAFEAPG